MIINNLCPTCNSHYQEQGFNADFMVKYKIYPSMPVSDMILVCTCPESSSILDIGCCYCGSRGFIMPPEERRGIYKGTDYMLDFSGERVTCSSCPKPRVCSHCGKDCFSGIHEYTLDGVVVDICARCKSNYYYNCIDCGKLLRSTSREHNFCQECVVNYFKCECCGRYRPHDHRLEVGDVKGCTYCISVAYCSYCDERRPCLSVNDVYLCNEHIHLKDSIARIGGYHHTKAVEFKKIKGQNTPLFFGIEWEFMARIYGKKFPVKNIALRKAIMAKEVEKRFPDVELKRDGSLTVLYNRSARDVGVEAVWQPMTFEYIKSVEDLFIDMFANIKDYHPKMEEKAGMHIHISKDAFTPLHFMKFLQFFYITEKLPFSVFIAGRQSSGYAKRTSTYTGNGYNMNCTPKALTKNRYYIEGKAVKRHRYTSFERYEVVNIHNKDTIEVRMFKAPTDAITFISNIEYLHSVYMYTLNKAISKINLDDYFTYVYKHSKIYNNLITRIEAYKRSLPCV